MLRKKREMLKKKQGGEEAEVDEEAEEIVVRFDFVASGSRDNSIILWNANRGESVMNLNGHDGWVNRLVFHHNGKYLIQLLYDSIEDLAGPLGVDMATLGLIR